MSPIVTLFVLLLAVTPLVAGMSKSENRLKIVSATWLVVLLISTPAISTEWGRITSNLVDDSNNPHYGLPDIWNEKQVVCIHFPEDHSPDGYSNGRTHIDFDGIEFKVDDEWNQSGVCIGGFTGYTNGLELLQKATDVAGDQFSMNYTEFSFGIMIDSFGDVNPCVVYSCTNTSGAYWYLTHNGEYSTVGISDLYLEENSVISWAIVEW